MRYELATPLLFANLLRWVSPEIFRRWEISGGSVGTVKLAMDRGHRGERRQGDGRRRRRRCRSPCATARCNFFSGAPGRCGWLAGDREYLYSLTLPQLWDTQMGASRRMRTQGIPRFSAGAGSVDRCVAVAGVRRRRSCLLAEWLLYGRFRRGGLRRPLTFRHRTRTRGGGAAMTFDHPWALLLVAVAAGLGGVGVARVGAAAWRCCSRPARFAAIALALAMPRVTVYQSKVAVACWRTRRPACRPHDLKTESALADRVERARGRHWTRVIPFARATRTAAPDEHAEERLAAAPHRGRRGARHRSGSRHSRWRGLAAGRHGAAPAAGFRRQREPGQRGARHLAGAAAGHPHRYRAAGRTAQARTAARIASAFPGQVFSGERFPIEVTAGIAARRRTPPWS